MIPSIIATTLDGQRVRVETSLVLGLTPNKMAAGKTTLLLEHGEVVADEQYEILMAQFAAAWPRYSLPGGKVTV